MSLTCIYQTAAEEQIYARSPIRKQEVSNITHTRNVPTFFLQIVFSSAVHHPLERCLTFPNIFTRPLGSPGLDFLFILTTSKSARHRELLSTLSQSPERAKDRPASQEKKQNKTMFAWTLGCVLNVRAVNARRKVEAHVDAEGHQVVGVEEVVGDGLSQVEGQLDEPERCPGVCGGEDDPTRVAKNGRVCR